MNPIMRLGNQRGLQIDDLYKVLPEDGSEHLGFSLLRYYNNIGRSVTEIQTFLFFGREWKKELIFANQNDMNIKKKPSLAKALVRTFGPKTLMLGLVAITQECIFR